jgi:hypothetical protein
MVFDENFGRSFKKEIIKILIKNLKVRCAKWPLRFKIQKQELEWTVRRKRFSPII